MACEEAVAKTANLMVSRVHWSHMDLHESIAAQDQEAHGMKIIKNFSPQYILLHKFTLMYFKSHITDGELLF